MSILDKKQMTEEDSHDGMYPERNTGFKRCRYYGYGDRTGTA